MQTKYYFLVAVLCCTYTYAIKDCGGGGGEEETTGFKKSAEPPVAILSTSSSYQVMRQVSTGKIRNEEQALFYHDLTCLRSGAEDSVWQWLELLLLLLPHFTDT